MDNSETASNLSDYQSSNLSSLSGLTGYEDELYSMRHLTRLSKNLYTNGNGQPDVHEDKIKKLDVQLQNALKLNEKYKNDLYNLERKTELTYHEKLQKLISHNVQLEGQLSVANNYIREFSSNRSTEFVQLGKRNFEVDSKINSLQNEVAVWKGEAENYRLNNDRLKLDLEETKIDVETKSNSILGLKGKIVDLHLDIQKLTQNNIKLNNTLAITTNELLSYKKSELWYKEQLHQCRLQKSQVSKEVARSNSLLITKERDLVILQKRIDELLRAESFVEKKESPKPIEAVNNNDEAHKLTIQNLRKELGAINEVALEQQQSFDNINRHNSELLSKNTILQNLLNDKETLNYQLENDRRDLEANLKIVTEKLQSNEQLLMRLANDKSEIVVALQAANCEKKDVEETVTTIRENFAKLVCNYNKLKGELCEKRREIEVVKREFENEIDLLEKKHKYEILATLGEKERERAALEERRGREIEELKRNHDDEVRSSKQTKKEEFQVYEQQFHREFTFLGQQHDSVVATMKKQHDDEKMLFRKQHQGEVVLLRKQHENEIASLRKQVENVTVQSSQTIDALKREMAGNSKTVDKTRDFLCILQGIRASLSDGLELSVTETDVNPEITDCVEEVRCILNGRRKTKGANRKLDIVDGKIAKMEDLCALLQKRADADDEIVRELMLAREEGTKALNVMRKAKEAEYKEKQIRCEISNRTLLKKVKEHLRARNCAEKRCARLQDELNACKLRESTKDDEVRNLQVLHDNYKNVNVKMRQELLNLQKELGVAEANNKLRDLVESRIVQKESLIDDLHVEIRKLTRDNEKLRHEHLGVLERNEQLSRDSTCQRERANKLESMIEQTQDRVHELNGKYLEEQTRHASSIVRANQEQDDNKLLTEQLNDLKLKLYETRERKASLENNWEQLQADVRTVRDDLRAAESDKYFVQRLCKDLKIALHTSLTHNKVLKEHIKTLSSESRDYASLPDFLIDIPSPTRYDDTYINQLLVKHTSPVADKPLADLQICLDLLKREMSCFREQVFKKTRHHI